MFEEANNISVVQNPRESNGDIGFTSILKRTELTLLLFIVLSATSLLYIRALQNGILSWDDQWHITYNLDIQKLSLENIKKIFTSYYGDVYDPLVMIGYALQFGVFGLNPVVFHATNILFHLANVTLVFLFTLLLSKKRGTAFLAALLFGIHPMHVESVAWITEFKDVLYVFFFLLSLISYCRYSSSAEKKYYRLAVLFFLLSLLSKPAAIILPFILLLIDFYVHRTMNRSVILEKLPWFILSLIFGVIAFHSQRESMVQSPLSSFSLFDRLILIFYSLSFYFFHAVVPLHLSALHLVPEKMNNLLSLEYYFATLLLFIAVGLLLRNRGTFRHELAFGLLFFFIALLPALQMVPFGKAIVAERYSYLPYIGLYFIIGQFFCLVSGSSDKFRFRQKGLLWASAALIVCCFGYLTYERIGVWKNSKILFTDASTTADSPKRARQLKAFGYELDAQERRNAQDYIGAIENYNTAILTDSTNAKSYNDRGYMKYLTNDIEGAFNDYSTAIKLNPRYPLAYANRAFIYLQWNKQTEACADLYAAYNLGIKNIYSILPAGARCP
jgi:protein O-mannosyl-transferase